MSGAEASGTAVPRPFPVDLGWRNVVFSLRTAVAAIAALAVSYWLELQDPGWSILTVYLLAQPTAGAAMAKGVYRIVGTLVGALWGLVALVLFAEAGPPFVATMVLWLGFCIYFAAKTRNFASYGFMLAGYTALLVGYEGAAAPTDAWQIAVDRSTEIGLGILCSAAASVLVLPTYAGDVLRAAMLSTFSGLARYGAVSLRPTTLPATFIALRRQMIGEVVKFDALRSYTAFEAPEMRADDLALRRVVREFLAVLAIARGLFFRLEDFRSEAAGPVLERLRPALDATIVALERIGADRDAVRNPRRTRHALLDLRQTLGAAGSELEALAGAVPLDPLANGVLILRRAGDMIHGLSMVMVSEVASVRIVAAHGRGQPRARPAVAPGGSDAWLQAVRAGLALAIVSVFWAVTEWTAGFSAVSGLGVMLFLVQNQDDPGRAGWPYLIAVVLALVVAYAVNTVVLTHLEGFEALALVLLAVLLPAGLVVGTPRWTMPGAGFAAFFVSEVGTGNVFQIDPQSYANSAVGLVLGMLAGLLVAAALPVSSAAARRRAWCAAMRALAEAARGGQPERGVADGVLEALSALLPRLDLDRPGEETVLRGMLGAASTSLELGRLRRVTSDPAMPASARAVVDDCLERLTAAFAALAAPRADRAAIVATAETATNAARASLAAMALEPGSPAARTVVRSAASLRFVADRFGIDRAFLLRDFGEDEAR